jgi:ATP-binding cassette subfamily C protein
MGMREALAAAGAQTVVARLDAGLDSVVGENGILLSGGERQRLAIARALLRRPPLLVLDEATNAIDGTTEHALLARLAALPWHPTIVLLAHRHESLACCDRILTFTEGRIVADERRKTMPVAHPAGGKR